MSPLAPTQGLSDTRGTDWRAIARSYNQLTSALSAAPIGEMLGRANRAWPFGRASGVHDSGCGPGPVLARLIADYGRELPRECALSASDFSAGMIEQVEQTKAEELERDPDSPWGRVRASVLDSMDLRTVADGSKSHVTAGWVYFMTPSPQKCLAESLRVLQPGGVLSCSSWKDSQWMQLMQTVRDIRPETPLPHIPDEWKTTEGLHGELATAGFEDVEAVEVEVAMRFDSHDALLDLLTLRMPHMVNLLASWSEEEVAKLRGVMAKRLEEYCPTAAGELSGVALVAVGRKR